MEGASQEQALLVPGAAKAPPAARVEVQIADSAFVYLGWESSGHKVEPVKSVFVLEYGGLWFVFEEGSNYFADKVIAA